MTVLKYSESLQILKIYYLEVSRLKKETHASMTTVNSNILFLNY